MLRLVQTACVIVLALPLAGSIASHRLNILEFPQDLQPSWKLIHQHLANRNYADAILESEGLARIAHQRGLHRVKSRLLSIKAGAQVLTFRYHAAAQTYLNARETAERVADWPLVALTSFNLSNVYYHLGALTESAAAARRANKLATSGGSMLSPIDLTLHNARLAGRTQGPTAARPLLEHALELAQSSGAERRIALVQEMTAVQFWEAGLFDQAAERAALARKLRSKAGDPLLSTSLLTLARIRLSQDRAQESLLLIDQAFAELKRHAPQRPLFRFYQLRGEAKAALGQLEPARQDLRIAVEHLRLLRPEAIPAEAVRMRAAASQQDVFTHLAEVCNEIYLRSNRAEDLWEGFTAANENRAWTMRQIIGQRVDPAPAYAAALSALQAAELQALRDRSPESLASLAAARLRIAELEFAPGSYSLPSISTPDLRLLQSQLKHHNAVIQFQVGKRRAYAWVLEPNRLTLVPLAPSAALQTSVRRMRDLIEQDSPAAARASHELYQSLFGGLPKSVHSIGRWTILPDQFLYQVPFAALVSNVAGNSARYLMEDVALQLTPFLSAAAASPGRRTQAKFIGFGDPIYNTADSRWHPPRSGRGWLQWSGLRASNEATSLPRLPGTAHEIRRSAQNWNGPAETLTGAQVSSAALRAAFAAEPEVVHIATHLVPGAADPSESRLMLSLSSSGEPELLDPVAVSHFPARCSLVVMSGCRAGAADAIAGEGLLGLSRAWLAAGASSVLATQWPMPDDSGEMWESFYRAWRGSELPPGASRASLALQTAQKEMLASSTWRARPRFWASYFVIGSR